MVVFESGDRFATSYGATGMLKMKPVESCAIK